MSLNDEMTSLMDAVRVKYAVTDKLSIADATGYISKPEIYNVVDVNDTFTPNNSSSTTAPDGAFRIVSENDDTFGLTGTFMFYDQSKIIPGNRYKFTTLIRGNVILRKFGEESNAIWTPGIQLTENWQLFSFDFRAVKDIVIYAKSKKGDWMDLKDWHFSEVAG